ncbi:transposase [Bradyrhizobium sp. WSM2793]|uniref:transposase n=1 Tax=Bradyrhizobium sp. WSM2793 TaxID=1038866 RepID=UPI0035289603
MQLKYTLRRIQTDANNHFHGRLLRWGSGTTSSCHALWRKGAVHPNTKEQIIAVLKEHEAGVKTADLARKHGIFEATIYNWKAKFGAWMSLRPSA